MKRLKTIMLLVLLSLPLCGLCQGFEDEEDTEDLVPVDGGLSLLAISGIAYGAKKWHELKKEKKG